MNLNNITAEDLKNHRIVPVMWGPEHGLLFLVQDTDTPQVPGYPPRSLEYVDFGLAHAYKVIEAKYKQFDYWPKFHDRNEFYSRGLDKSMNDSILRS